MLKKKIKLMVLDDERDICEFVKALFRKKGFSVSSALSGNEAIRKIKKLKPDVALLDIYLKKGLDGLEALKKIREISPLCRCVMVTWDSAVSKIKEAKKMGAVSYLVKPITITELLRVVYRAVSGIRKRGK